jgi:hypothetical protein
MARLLAWVSIGIVAFSLSGIGICFIGRLYVPPEIAGFDCTPAPCWHGIQLGITSMQEAERLLSSDPTITLLDHRASGQYLCWQWQNGWQVESSRFDGRYNDQPAFPMNYSSIMGKVLCGLEM